jgi:hypothetical protein
MARPTGEHPLVQSAALPGRPPPARGPIVLSRLDVVKDRTNEGHEHYRIKDTYFSGPQHYWVVADGSPVLSMPEVPWSPPLRMEVRDMKVYAAYAACLSLLVVPACQSGESKRAPDAGPQSHFSFFVTSLRALQDLSGSPTGFGGDLRFGETGPGAGLRGADKICATIAEKSMPGASARTWRAFLSATADETGQPVNAIDRIGNGPWYDRRGRLLAPTLADLRSIRPQNGDPAIRDDFPNEDGIPNHDPDLTGQVDNHDMLTGSDSNGKLLGPMATCLDWTSATGDRSTEGRPRVGHSWPRFLSPNGDGGFPFPIGDGGFPFPIGDGGFPFPIGDGGFPFPIGDGGFPFLIGDGGFSLSDLDNWISALDEAGCGPGVNIVERGPPIESENNVGSGGGYGGFYCFALTP